MRTLGLTGLGQGRSVVPYSSSAVPASSVEKGKWGGGGGGGGGGVEMGARGVKGTAWRGEEEMR